MSLIDIINPELLQDAGFSLKKDLATVLSAAESTSETEDRKSHSNQESTRTADSQVASVQYVQLHPKAMGTGLASMKCCPSLTKPSIDLPTLTTARVFYLPIDDTQAAWLNCFLMNTDTPSDVHLEQQQCGVGHATPKVYLCPWG